MNKWETSENSMEIREITEELEEKTLSPFAQKAKNSKGRRRFEEKDLIRTDFQRDRDRILHSKAFRRLKHKTQVFIAPEGDHYRTRLTHTLEVSQIARTIARALRLNEDLTEAVSLGHDLGHTPFGHAGEDGLREILGEFNHNEQSVRVVEYLEKNGAGLNLTHEVKEGILNHTGTVIPRELENQVVRVCDRVAYLAHDIDDSVRAGIISIEDIPPSIRRVLGEKPRDIINTLATDIIYTSMNLSEIRMSSRVEDAMDALRNFMFQKVYLSPQQQKEKEKAKKIVQQLYCFYMNDLSYLPDEYQRLIAIYGIKQVVTDYVASMTDYFAVNAYNKYFKPAHPIYFGRRC